MAINVWTTYRINEVGEIVTGTTPSTKERSYWGGNIPFVTPADMNGTQYVYTTERMVTSKGAATGRMLPSNAVLVTCIGSVGKMALAPTPCITHLLYRTLLQGILK
jgi:type I restriction enzyme S subunit